MSHFHSFVSSSGPALGYNKKIPLPVLTDKGIELFFIFTAFILLLANLTGLDLKAQTIYQFSKGFVKKFIILLDF